MKPTAGATTWTGQLMTSHTIEAEGAQPAAEMVRHGLRHLPVTKAGGGGRPLSTRNLLALRPWPEKLPIAESW